MKKKIDRLRKQYHFEDFYMNSYLENTFKIRLSIMRKNQMLSLFLLAVLDELLDRRESEY